MARPITGISYWYRSHTHLSHHTNTPATESLWGKPSTKCCVKIGKSLPPSLTRLPPLKCLSEYEICSEKTYNFISNRETNLLQSRLASPVRKSPLSFNVYHLISSISACMRHLDLFAPIVLHRHGHVTHWTCNTQSADCESSDIIALLLESSELVTHSTYWAL